MPNSCTFYLFFNFSSRSTKDTALFPGKNQYERSAKYFEFTLNKYIDEIKDNFCVDVKKDIGVHLLRKGAASYVTSGLTCAPPQVATDIRAG